MNMDKQQVSVEKLIYGGMGLARIDGQVVLTPFVLPGKSDHRARGEARRSPAGRPRERRRTERKTRHAALSLL